MRKLKRLACAIWLMLWHAALGAQARPDPAEALARAIAETRSCDAHVEGRNVASLDTDDVSIAKKLSLKRLFRPGRFDLAWKLDGPEAVIAFAPTKEGLAPKHGEDKNVNKVLNRLSGEVYLDQETGEITRVEGNLDGSVWVSPHWYEPLWLNELTFHYFQAPSPRGWMPKSLMVDARGYFLPKHYPLLFDCGS